MSQAGRSSSAAPSAPFRRLQGRPGGDEVAAPRGVVEAGEDFVFGRELVVDPRCDDSDLWLSLERFRVRRSLTEDLQRPFELRLAERRPTTLEGALKSLELARYLMAKPDTADGTDLGTGFWYRRLRNHLVDSAHEALTGRLLPQRAGRRQASTGQRLEGRDHADR